MRRKSVALWERASALQTGERRALAKGPQALAKVGHDGSVEIRYSIAQPREVPGWVIGLRFLTREFGCRTA